MATKKKSTNKNNTTKTLPKLKKAVTSGSKKTSSKKVVKPKSTTTATKTSNSKKVTKKVSKQAAKKVSTTDINTDNLIHGVEPYKEKAREKYMNPNQVEHFRNILVSWKTNLLDEVSRTINLMQDERAQALKKDRPNNCSGRWG